MQTAHLKLLSREASTRAGLNAEQQNLEVLCSDPMEGTARLKHDLEATINPDFMGLQGTLKLLGRPESRLLPVRDAIGLKLYAEFTELASSVDDGADWSTWQRRRFTPDGGKTPTGGPSGSWQSETVRLRFVRERGDEVDDYAPVTAEAVALVGTLANSDQLTHPLHGFFEVRGVTQEAEFERARLER